MQAKLLKQPAATPETWRCEVEREEFCQFLSGRCVYTADDGTRLEIEGGDAADGNCDNSGLGTGFGGGAGGGGGHGAGHGEGNTCP